MRDIKPGERSIRDIPVSHRHREHHQEPELPKRRPRRRGGKWWLVLLILALIAAGAGVALSTVFAGASVSVTPRVEEVQLPASVQAQLNAPVGTPSFQIITVTRSASQTVSATGTTKVSRAASGTVIIANTYSTAPQRLIANTRFEATDGKIYRIRDSVTVPGMSGTKAGEATATIYADSPGPTYNRTEPTTFTIPGFKGDPRYSKFSARSEGAISGGFVGDDPSVAPADLAAAKDALQKKLDQDARAAPAGQIAEGYVAIPGTLEVTFSQVSQIAGENSTANLTQSATAKGAIMRQGDLAAAVAKASVQGYKGESVLFGDISQMQAQAASTTKLSSGTIQILMNGKTQLVWQYDPNALKEALLGKSKAEFEQVIAQFAPAVASADATIRPFWSGKFPSDPAKIKITSNNK